MLLGLPKACFYVIIYKSETKDAYRVHYIGGINMGTLDWLLLAISVILIAIVLLQESKNDVKNTFSGEKSDLFKNQKQRGPELFLSRATAALSFVFVAVTILALVL